ncbi:MAG: winged helix-turn-helix transcriptional regulator [Alphaproteobacteria bacterium]|nr:MarR family winged helix-turn-helix transcriptional regulator [Alphaproteobacteria bacterium]MDE2072295.1 winged helix-turn-helix transcriptional regulator [Alphaproteobacteria bacterium]
MADKTKKARAAHVGAAGLSLHEYQLLAEFRYLLARFLAFSEAAAQEAGLAPRQHQALLAIKGYPGGDEVTVGDLAERLGIRHHSAVGLVDRLVASGYLTRCGDPEDRRRILLSLTALGDKTLADLSAIHRAELRRITPLLKPVLTQLGTPAAGR